MTVRLEGETVRLEGDCLVEEAETLTALLQDRPERTVDLTLCRHLHGAVAQALLAFAPAVSGDAADGFLRDLVTPALGRARTGGRDNRDPPG